MGEQHGDRMWVNTLALLASSYQETCGTVLAQKDPLAKSSMGEMFEDAELFFRYKHDAKVPVAEGALDLTEVAKQQLSVSQALKQIPSSDFRTWAVGLTQIAVARSRK